jgi:uncharacterized protein DUF3135
MFKHNHDTKHQKMESNRIFDFDYWSKLYEVDPKKFERNRADLIDQVIGSIPIQRRLEAERLVFRINAIRYKKPNPLSSCIELYSIMWDNFLTLNETLNQFSNSAQEN